MNHGHTKESLIAFEEKVKEAFLAKKIRAPIHLCSETQAEPLLEIFEHVKPNDWLFSTWRSHYHCLVKGMPEDELFEAILQGRSMYVCSAQHKIVCSAIVAGILPMALGVAMGIKKQGLPDTVYVCIGDMTARTGLFFEFIQYWKGHSLPIRVIVEDNGLSTNAPTEEVWGCPSIELCRHGITEYRYERTFPHTGVGETVVF